MISTASCSLPQPAAYLQRGDHRRPGNVFRRGPVLPKLDLSRFSHAFSAPRNAEYGIRIDSPALVDNIQGDFDDLRAAATTISIDDLLQYARVAAHVRRSAARKETSVDPRLKRALQAALNEAEDHLIRLRLAGGAMHTVFAHTIRYLLTKYGASPTPRIHEFVQRLHSDLCDDSVDRVIDGKHFGKKWKHAVRTAQQQLKKAGIIDNANALWRIAG